MSMVWPGFLWLLALIPLIVAAYIWILRRRRRYVVRYSSLSLVRQALPRASGWRRHLPFALFLLALSSLIAAMGRPTATVSVPNNQTAVVLALDVSRSMCQTDIPPNRLEAAKAAAMSFIDDQGRDTQIGIVAFAGFAEQIIAPTNDHEALRVAIQRLAPGRRTAIGSGILESLDAISDLFDDVPPSGVDVPPDLRPQLEEGQYPPYMVVLLTDGVSNAGIHPIDAAQQAQDRGVRVYTIGFGTANTGAGPIPFCGPGFQQMENDPFGGSFFGGGGGGGGFNRGIDEETLKQVASMTGGEYYSAESASQLNEVFQKLPTYSIIEQQHIEISAFFAMIGAALVALAVLFSLLWHPL